MEVTIIIVNYNTCKMTSECIESVIEKTKGLEYEIILVDNASTDGSKEFFEQDTRIKYIYLSENVGFGRANNFGFSYSSGDYIFLLNSDTILVNNAIKILYDFINSKPEVSICGGQLLTKEGLPTHSYSLFLPSVHSELDIFLNNLISKSVKFYYSHFSSNLKCFRVGYITGADMMMKRKDIESLGMFDERFFMYFEESELSFRYKKAKREIAFCPDAEIIHLQGASFKISEFQETTYNKSRRIYYDIVYPKWKFIIANTIYKLTCISRIFIFRLINNKTKYNFWRLKYNYFKRDQYNQ